MQGNRTACVCVAYLKRHLAGGIASDVGAALFLQARQDITARLRLAAQRSLHVAREAVRAEVVATAAHVEARDDVQHAAVVIVVLLILVFSLLRPPSPTAQFSGT